ncbi:MAG TPA: autotransporter outer membrane beta-barrel domain-containing protein [Planctomycetes bacterium]|nr:autotransporter outer membrane beta-barrel domain-containing protein [Planctomycetota bacterium]HIK60691.1 autotransporter outer membrane beta-barrel domain-containing protein [Planctomycetota bacterium]
MPSAGGAQAPLRCPGAQCRSLQSRAGSGRRGRPGAPAAGFWGRPIQGHEHQRASRCGGRDRTDLQRTPESQLK